MPEVGPVSTSGGGKRVPGRGGQRPVGRTGTVSRSPAAGGPAAGGPGTARLLVAAIATGVVVGGISITEPVLPALHERLLGSGSHAVVVAERPGVPGGSPAREPSGAANGAPRIEPVPPPDVPVLVRVDGEVRTILSAERTVEEILAIGGVSLGPLDRVEPSIEHRPAQATLIVVQRVEVVEEVHDTPIPYDTREQQTDTLVEGEREIVQGGVEGLRRTVVEVTLVDGRERHREVVSEQRVTAPVDHIVLVGTAPPPLREAQQLLVDLGYPAGPVDGIDGPQTRRGLCAWRRLEGREVARDTLREGELEALRATPRLPDAPAGRGVQVDRTCQVLAYRDAGAWQAVHPASTGEGGLPSVGRYAIHATRAGWHTSTLYPAPQPNMYNSLFFHGAIALHGAHHVPPHPASAGCVRVTPQDADHLFSVLRVGDPVEVVGAY